MLQDMKTHRKGEIQITNEKGNGNNEYMMVLSKQVMDVLARCIWSCHVLSDMEPETAASGRLSQHEIERMLKDAEAHKARDFCGRRSCLFLCHFQAHVGPFAPFWSCDVRMKMIWPEVR